MNESTIIAIKRLKKIWQTRMMNRKKYATDALVPHLFVTKLAASKSKYSCSSTH
jgi:hypothetical protein